MGIKLHLHPVVNVPPIRVVVQVFGMNRTMSHEAEGLRKIRKAEFGTQSASFITPAVQICKSGTDF